MSTFSSVVRKPGQTIKPKVAPRRNVQRHTQKSAVAATLTPDSLPQSPNLQPISQPRPSSDAPSSHDPIASTQTEQEVVPPLTPPATAVERPGSTSGVEDAAVPRSLRSDAVPSQIESVRRTTPDTSSTVVSPRSLLQRGRKRTADAVEGTSAPAQTATERDGTSTPPVRTPASSTPASKRRKVAPQAGPSYILSRPSETPARAQTETPANHPSSSTAEERARATTEDLLQQATAQFGSVSKIADSIENRTRNLRPRTGRGSTYVEIEDEDEDYIPRRRNQRSSRSTAIEDHATAVIDEATGRSRRRGRQDSTPEDPESHEIDIKTVTMNDLTKDSGLGQRSATGRELEENWAEIQKRWKEGPEENRQKARQKTRDEKDARKRKDKEAAERAKDALQPEDQQLNTGTYQPQRATIVNGLIVAETSAREIDFRNNIEERAQRHESQAREVRKIDNYVNSHRVGRHAGLHANPNRWNDQAIELFYKGLRMFGTDFEMIATLFPNRERPEIKAKYTKELKDNSVKVEDSLANREEWTLEEYAEMVDREDPFEDPEKLDAELAALKARMHREDEDRKRQAGLIADREEADQPMPSVEVDAEGNEIVRESTGPPADEHIRRVQSTADAAVRAAVGPAKKKTRARKARDTSKVTKGKKGKPTLAGVEEPIGRIDEVEI